MTADRPILTIDTNILIYAIDLDAGEKHERARALMSAVARADGALTLQALGEFFHATTRKKLLSAEKAERYINDWQVVFPIVAADETALIMAIGATREHVLFFWDALLWATARLAGCTVIVSEDMQHGRDLGGVEVIDPFSEPGGSKLAELLGL